MTPEQITEMLRAILETTSEKGFPPTARELAHHLGVASHATILRRLAAMQEQGVVQRTGVRNLVITTSGAQFLGQ